MARRQFSYEARDRQGNKVSGTVEAIGREDAFIRLRNEGLSPWRLDEQGEAKPTVGDRSEKEGSQAGSWTPERVWDWLRQPIQPGKVLSPQQQGDVLWQLAGLIQAGLPVDDALAVMARVQGRRQVKALLEAVTNKVRQGRSLADALAEQRMFPPFVISMVHAGEASGDLEGVLYAAAGVMRQNAEIRALIRSSLAYPLFLLGVSVVAVVTLLTVVVPRFLSLFSAWGEELPVATQILLSVHAGLQAWGGPMALLLLLFIGAGVAWVRTSRNGRLVWGRLMLRMPLLGPALRDAEAVRLVRTLAVMLRGGISLPLGLDVAAGVVVNAAIGAAVRRAGQLVQDGASLAGVWRTEKVLPPAVAELVAVGEATGELPPVLERAAQLLEEQTRQRIKYLATLLEPALLLGMALVIGFIVIAILLPIVSLTNFPL